MSYYEDDYYCEYQETEQERAAREERNRRFLFEIRRKQLACPHADRVQVGSGCTARADGTITEYITMVCRDCELEEDIELSKWQQRATA